MLKWSLLALLLLPACAQDSLAQRRAAAAPYGLPRGAVVVETRALEVGGAKRRALVLWMLRPKKYPRGVEEEGYTCPEETRGSFYRGPARVSLVDTEARRVINTLKVVQEYSSGEDEFDVPYRIRAGGYYHVEGVAEGREGRPTVLHLRDFDGDGRAREFALFDALACMGLETALFGYSETLDRVIQYGVALETEAGGSRATEVLNWVDYLFAKKQAAPGVWKYEVDYRGRGGSLDAYEVRYNSRAGRFEGTLRRTTDEQ